MAMALSYEHLIINAETWVFVILCEIVDNPFICEKCRKNTNLFLLNAAPLSPSAARKQKYAAKTYNPLGSVHTMKFRLNGFKDGIHWNELLA